MSSDNHRIRSRAILAGLCFAVLAPGAIFGQVVPPEPVETQAPEAPAARGMPIEGWATVRYSVLADGTTADVRVIDRMPAALLERVIREAVEGWTFEPATSDGVPIDWHNNEATIVVDADMVPPDPRPAFIGAYREVESLLEIGENEDALKRSDRLLGMEVRRLAEMGVALVQHARVNMALDNQHEAYASIRRVTAPGISLLEPSELSVALEYRNTLELLLGDVVGALETFDRRQQLAVVPETDRMHRNVEVIESALDSDRAIAVKGKILDDVWRHDMKRRTFAIGDLEGDLKQVDVECDRRTAELEYSETSEWSLPESWGACTVFVSGRGDSEFVLYEFP